MNNLLIEPSFFGFYFCWIIIWREINNIIEIHRYIEWTFYECIETNLFCFCFIVDIFFCCCRIYWNKVIKILVAIKLNCIESIQSECDVVSITIDCWGFGLILMRIKFSIELILIDCMHAVLSSFTRTHNELNANRNVNSYVFDDK